MSGGESRTSSGRAVQDIVPHGKDRLVLNYCPCCREELGRPYSMGMWLAPEFTRNVFYHLCQSCGPRMEKANKRGRARLLGRIERNLKDMGALVGLEREGLRA